MPDLPHAYGTLEIQRIFETLVGPSGSGSQGPPGVDGPPGPQGDPGAPGTDGADGSDGVQGATGFQGIQGIQGVPGTDGNDGAQGVPGATGSQGIQGIAGATGSQGIQGVQGNAGVPGVGVITGGTINQVLAKASSTDFDTAWVTPGAGSDSETVVRLAVAQATTSSALGDLTGLSFAVAANKDYLVEGDILYTTAAATTGIGFAVNGPAAPISLGGMWWAFTANTTALYHRASQYNAINTASTGVANANATEYAGMRWFFRNGANAGTFQIRWASEVNTSQVRAHVGSVVRWRLLN